MANVNVGDTVMVPGDMHGTVKFIGSVAGKRGTFAGVQLATEYAGRGKNSGEVDGKSYFRTTIPGSGIFLPLEKAVKKPGSAG
jgi:dynactin complex subunit